MQCKRGTDSWSGYGSYLPYHVWTSTASGKNYYIFSYLGNSRLEITTAAPKPPSSVRCVLSSYVSSKSLSGGSGGSGGYIKNVDITEYVKEAQKRGGGKIILRAGNGGSSTIAGSTSYVYVYDVNGGLLYAISTAGGGKGGSASSSSYGSGGGGGMCSKYNTVTGKWDSATCTGNNGKNGGSGSSGTYSSFGIAVTGPSGANSAYSNSGGGSGGSSSHTAGYSASSYGAGGGGVY